MTTDTRTIRVPESLYRRFERLSALKHQPIDVVIAQALSSSIPPLPDDLAPEWRDTLMSLEAMSDAELWDQTHATLPDAEYTQIEDLRDKRREGTLSPDEVQTLDDLLRATDLLTLRKAYAAVLLKWRGHRLPTLEDASA
jgi:hypothetical protein